MSASASKHAQSRPDDRVVVDDPSTRIASLIPSEPLLPTSFRRRVPTRSRACRRRARRAPHADDPESAFGVGTTSPGAKPSPSSSTTATTVAGRRQGTLTYPGARMLDHVRERLLHDPVERSLDLGREPLRPIRASESTPIPSLRRRSRQEAFERRHEPGSRRAPSARARPRACGRSAASSPRAHGPRPSRVPSPSARRPGRIDVNACPVSSWSSRASRFRSSSCASTTAAPSRGSRAGTGRQPWPPSSRASPRAAGRRC